MNISHTLIALGLAFSLLGSTSAFARPTLHFENGGLSHEKKMVASHVPTAKAFGARPPAANADKDGWPANMLLD